MPTDDVQTLRLQLSSALRPSGRRRGVLSTQDLSRLEALLAGLSDPGAGGRALVEALGVALREDRVELAGGRHRRLDDFLERCARRGWLPATLAPGDRVAAVRAWAPPEPPAPAPPAPSPPGSDPSPPGSDPSPSPWATAPADLAALDAEALLSWLWERRHLGPAPATAVPPLVRVLEREQPSRGPGKLALAGARLLAAWLLPDAPNPAAWSAVQDDPRPVLQDLVGARTARGAQVQGPRLDRLTELVQGGPHLAERTARLLLCGLAFCKHDEAAALLLASPEAVAPLGAEAAATLAEALRTYVEDSDKPVFAYGVFAESLQARVGEALHQAAVAGCKGALAGSPPALGGVLLTAEQAAWLAGELALVRHGAAAEALESALQAAATLFPGAPGEHPLPAVAFEAVRRALEAERLRAAQERDGRSDLTGLVQAVHEDVQGLAHALRPALADLASGTWEGRAWAPDHLEWLIALLRERVASPMAVENLATAARLWLDARPDDVAGLQDLVTSYVSEWPTRQVFDFNKLVRMARVALGDPGGVLCRVNGQPVPPGELHRRVGEAVFEACQRVGFPYPWVARRWGYRARQGMELVDLIAEQAERGRGPVATLHRAFPGQPVVVVCTTSDMEYNQFVFGVQREAGTAWHYMRSDGNVVPHARAPEEKHKLFTAAVAVDGTLEVEVAAVSPLSPRAYPLMNTYGVGDFVDVEHIDAAAHDRQREGEPFQTRRVVVRARVVSFDDGGVHTLRLELKGNTVDREVDAQELRAWNNPHLVDELGGQACDMRFDRQDDRLLESDLREMEAIARDAGLLDFDLGLSELELATRQKAFLKALNDYTAPTLRYPRKPPVDEADETYWRDLDFGTHPAGQYLALQRGVCRHQFVRAHMGKQRGGVDERFASGAANTSGGQFRGLHIWGEVQLADRSRLATEVREPTDPRYLSDATWGDPYVPLWERAYGMDQRRVEMYDRTRRYLPLLADTDGA